MSTIDDVKAVCRVYYGAYRGHGHWSPPNRCGACPFHAPCMERGGTQATTHEQLDAASAKFYATAIALLDGKEKT